MNARTWALGLVITAAGGLGLAPQAQATLIGDTVNFELTGVGGFFTVTPNSAMVDAGVEAQIVDGGTPGIDIDVDDASITLTPLSGILFPALALTISDMDWVNSPGRIVNFGLVNNGVFNLDATDITIGDDFVTIDLGLTIWNPDDSAVINLEVAHDPVTTNAVPEPITAGLGLMALAGLGYATKRRRIG